MITILNIKNKYLIKSLERICVNIYRRFDNIAVSSYGFIEVLTSYGISSDKILYIPQHIDSKTKRKVVSRKTDDELKIVFTGNIGTAQNLVILAQTALFLKRNEFFKVHFLVVGDGRERKEIEQQIKDDDLESYFTFTGYVQSNEIPAILEKTILDLCP